MKPPAAAPIFCLLFPLSLALFSLFLPASLARPAPRPLSGRQDPAFFRQVGVLRSLLLPPAATIPLYLTAVQVSTAFPGGSANLTKR